jgi:endonuclease-8
VDEDAPVAGREVLRVRAAGKHLLIELSGDLVLRTHMRMNGSWHVYRPGERWRRSLSAMRVLLRNEEYEAVGFDIPVAEFLTTRDLARHPELRELGPDLLDDAFDAAEAAGRLMATPQAELGDALLNQRAMAGVGNVFKSEVLFVAGLDPFRHVGSLEQAELALLINTARELLRANVIDTARSNVPAWGGYRRTTRSGRPCRRCGTPIAYAKQGRDARGTYWCPSCQG